LINKADMPMLEALAANPNLSSELMPQILENYLMQLQSKAGE
jgi:hypothetical protein